ncbi:heavy-metal transporter (plasmid) [Enterococcus faecium]|uniref:heavy-metal transporter n=1 Tax=Enterococcus faecium TaxID=1352 RepID=UPI00125FDEF2|nr:heavy-metal transporter [Enterococcus faecium]QIS84877.1 heavy-metal transporter [Enterococcus faecium]
MMNQLQIILLTESLACSSASKVGNALEAEPTVNVKIVELPIGIVTFHADSKVALTLFNYLLKNTKYTVTRNISI